MNIDNVTEE